MSIPDYFQTNTVYCGDCRDVLRKFPEKCVDLIYADPPFFSNKQYEVIWHDGYEIRAFEDRWKGGVQHYVLWMHERIEQCYRVLKDTGSMFLHCDWHAGHYLKVMMDEFFGYDNFVNEIVWCYSHGGKSKKHLGRKHDTIFWYAKSDNYLFNVDAVRFPMKSGVTSFGGKLRTDENGRKYRLVYGTKDSKGKTRYYKYYLDEGKIPEDYWTDINSIQSSSKERLGYPTQKPTALLERIIKIASNPIDIILDPFCGCGTAIVVAHKLGRRWIGIDVSPTACNLMMDRMGKIGAKPNLVGMPMSENDLRKLPPFEFQNWVVQRFFGRVSSRKSSDMGIDGYTFEGYPIQVKQSDDIGRNVVDNFETAMRRRKAKNGIIVAFSFGKGAYEEIARAKLHDALEIKAVTVKELIENKNRTL